MTFSDLAPFITSIASLIGAIAAVWGLRTSRRVEKHTNGMKDELVREVRAASFKAGVKEEKENPS